MKERPILFSAPMVRALLDGSKTQTRRVIKPQPDFVGAMGNPHVPWITKAPGLHVFLECPYGQPGDRLWVRETWQTHGELDGITPRDLPNDLHIQHPATYDGWVSKRRPSIFMPRWASRITLEIVSVRVERLQAISEADASAEGCERMDSEREVRDWKICPQCGGNGLYTAFSGSGGALPDSDCFKCDTYVKRYRHLWESINGAGSWDANPWVWVVEFKKVTPC